MHPFFAASLAKRAAPQSNLFLDWGAMIDARALKGQTPWSPPEAFLCILLAAAICDGPFTVAEGELVHAVAHRSRGLKTLSPEQFHALERLVVDRFKAGFESALSGACAVLPREIRWPAFAHALDIVLTDGALGEAEAGFLDALAERLELDPAQVERVADIMAMKNC
jgi:hypothetical protein